MANFAQQKLLEMKLRTAVLTVATLASSSVGLAQSLCGADELRISTLKQHPKVAAAVIARDARLEAFTSTYAANRGGEPEVFVIPVVFHVIHQYGTENISDAQLKDGLRVCNATFRKTSPDTANIIPAFKPIHADCGIEFRLATKDPDGNCHSGINRIASPLGTTGDHAVKALVHWDPTRYLNIYVVSNAAGLAGHAVWPADADTIPEWDGIVMSHDYIGAIGTSDQTRSVVFAHECGHYLNLHHIWGGNNVPNFYYLPVNQTENCNHDDLVDDTPNTIGWPSCNLSGSSCGNVVDNVQNAMDYSYCNIMFTNGQRDRMRACLASPIAGRNNLWQESNLIATGVILELATLCAADFIANRRAVCPNTDNQIVFTNTSFHGEIDSLRWSFPGGSPATSSAQSPIVTYSSAGMHDVALRAYAAGGFVETIQPDFITVLSSSSVGYPFYESFEENVALDGAVWSRSSLDAENRWELTDLAASQGVQSVWVDNWETTSLTRDELFGPPIDLSGASEMKFAFKYAFASNGPSTTNDRLQVMVTRNCETNWSPRLSLAGPALQTAPLQSIPFVPTQNQWVQEVVSVPTSHLSEGFRFKFVCTSAGGNRLYIDDVNIDINATVSDIALFSGLKVYPNPVASSLNVEITTKRNTNVTIEVTDITGRAMLAIGEQDFNAGTTNQIVNVEGLSVGMYLLRIRSADGTIAQRFAVQR